MDDELQSIDESQPNQWKLYATAHGHPTYIKVNQPASRPDSKSNKLKRKMKKKS